MKYVLITFFFFVNFLSFSQIKAFDKMEMLYAQQHYKSVYRKSEKYLGDSKYNFSKVPQLYFVMSSLQLSRNKAWMNRHPEAINNAISAFNEIKSSVNGSQILEAHIFELAYLRLDLSAYIEELIQTGDAERSKIFKNLIATCFDNLPNADDIGQVEDINSEDQELSSDVYGTQRLEIIEFAKKHIGIPYLWAGTDTTGFDCSGFTGYVMKNNGKTLPRRAIDQYASSTKLTEKNVKSGDLVFFDNGSGISHVGIIVSNKENELTMIHASSSKGIIITDIKQSSYWLPRLYGFGTYLY